MEAESVCPANLLVTTIRIGGPQVKVRCRKCHKVSKVKDYTVAVCKSCGETLDLTQMPIKGLAPATAPAGPTAPGSKGRLPVRNWKGEIGRVALALLALLVLTVGSIIVVEAVNGPRVIVVFGLLAGIVVMVFLAVWLERRAQDHPLGSEEPVLGSTPIGFQGNARVQLANREKLSLWDAGMSGLSTAPQGSIALAADRLHLTGRWSLPMMAAVFQQGLLGLLVIRLIRRPRVEDIPVDDIELLIIHRKRKTVTFHILQARDEGLAEVHVFQPGRKQDPEPIVNSLRSVIPPERVVFEGDPAPA
jgi:hypothetical protein